MKTIPYLTTIATIAIAGFSGVENFPFVGITVHAQEAVANVADIAKNFDPKVNLDLSGKQIAFKLPAGIHAKVIGSTYEQLINLNGKIRNPISPKTTKLTFELSDTAGKTAQTKTFEVNVPLVKHEIAIGAGNPKPTVIPALQEWVGTRGSFVPSKDFRIIIRKRDANIGTPTLQERSNLFARELSEIFGRKVEVSVSDNENLPLGNDIVLELRKSDLDVLGNEGYAIFSLENRLHISASDPLGIFWGTRTALQVFNQNKNTFPCGFVIDYPQYPLRGFMYDVGRKPTTLKAIKDVMKTMSYYKLNDLQLHLNDNYIWLHDYTKKPNGKDASTEDKKLAIEELINVAPTAFRLESNVVGKNGVPLTAKDFSYTKKDFGAFIDEAKLYGVNIVPEIDVPGHAMSFVRVRPELMYRGALTKSYDVERVAMLDASTDVFDDKTKRTYREETLSFVQSVFDEYLVAKDGEEPVFRDCVVHIGTDEYYGNSEDYRAFANEMLNYVKSRGHTPRLWGSLSRKAGKTPVDGTGAQTDIWALSWQTPHTALQHNFDIINILDTTSYIVPNGTGNVGGYCDYLNLPFLYSQTWHPHTMASHQVMPGHPKLLGAQWALWNDNSFRRDTGLTDYDLFDRIRKSCAVFAEKTWSTGEDNAYGDFIKLVDNVRLSPLSNPEYTAEIIDDNETLFDLKKSVPSGTTILTGIDGIAPDYVAEFRVKRTSDKKTVQTLSAGPTGKILAVQKDTGKVGVTRDTWDYSFDYTLPVGRVVTLKFIAKGRSLILFADGKEVGSAVRHAFPESHKYSTLVFPLATIGEKENAFAGEILSLNIKRWIDPRTKNAVPPSEILNIRASSEHGKGPDGDASKLIDGDTETYWHSRYEPKDNPPFELIVELKKPTTLTAFSFLPRQNNENGNVKFAELFLKKNDGSWENVGAFRGNGASRDLQTIAFTERTTSALKFVIREGNGGFGTLAEIYPIKK